MLGQYLLNLKFKAFDEKNHLSFIANAIKEAKTEMKIHEDAMPDILNPEFIFEEYHRIFYGMSCKSLEQYQTIARKGRGKRIKLDTNSERRKAIYSVVLKYLKWMINHTNSGHSFIARRQALLNEISKDTFTPSFDYVLVDEFQDCTPADYRIMHSLLKNVNNLIISGDLAQAVHIGQSGAIPKDSEMGKRKIHRLKGSYRLPYRISEAITPLSTNINSTSEEKEITSEITPFKGAPPGSRPIIVYADDNQSLCKKIVEIKKIYSQYSEEKATILEKDDELCRLLNNNSVRAETTSILKLKGLEKEFIVWSLQTEILYENEAKEFAYTIMTRTSCLLLIAITPNLKSYNLEIAKLLRPNRLIIWDKQTASFLNT